MAEDTLEIALVFKSGLRSEDSNNRGLLSATEFRGLRAEEFGARESDVINNILSANTMYIADRSGFHHIPSGLTFPEPQIFIGKSKSLILGERTLTEFDHVAGTMPGVLSDIRTVSNVENNVSGVPVFPANAGYWHMADFGDTYYLFCDDLVIIRSPFLKLKDDGTAIHFHSSAVTVRTGCAFRGQLITGGFAKADYHSAAWITLWDAWTTLANARGISTTAVKGPDKNWVRWGSIGGGDFILHWFPNTYAKLGERVSSIWNIPKAKQEHIANGDIEDGMLGWAPGPVDIADPLDDHRAGVSWFYDNKVIQTNRKALFFVHKSTLTPDQPLFLRQHTKMDFLSGVSYDVSIDLYTGSTGGPFNNLKISMGDIVASPVAISSDINPTAQDTWETFTFTLTPSATTNVVYVRPGSVIQYDDANRILFANLSIKPTNTPSSVDAYDTAAPYFWEFMRRGDIGFMPMPTQGAVLNTSPLRDHVIVFSEDSINAITPVVADGLPTYGLEENLYGAGILSRSALASDGRRNIIFIDETGELCHIDDSLKVNRLGFREYFSGKTDLIGGYDPIRKAFYIGDEDETFRLDKDGRLTQVRENRVTSIFSSGGALSGMSDTGHTSLGTFTWDFNGNWSSTFNGATGESFANLVAGSDILSSTQTYTTVIGKKYLVRVAIYETPTGSVKLTFAGVTTASFNTVGVYDFIIMATSISSKVVITPQSSANYTISTSLKLVASYDQDDILIETDYYDLNHAGFKTLEWLEIDYKDITDLEITITYYVDQDDSSPMTIGPLVGNNGQFHVGIAFTHFKLSISGIKGTDPSITRLDAKYSYIDNRAQRHSRNAPISGRSPVA